MLPPHGNGSGECASLFILADVRSGLRARMRSWKAVQDHVFCGQRAGASRPTLLGMPCCVNSSGALHSHLPPRRVACSVSVSAFFSDRPSRFSFACPRPFPCVALPTPAQSDTAVHCVAEGLKAGHPFREAELAELQLSGTALSELTLALASSGPLARLSLSECGLGDDGVQGLLPVVRTGALSALELRSNRIGNHGAGVLAEALAGNTNLQVLDLQRNDIKCQGAIGLAAALQVNRSLRVLNVRFNEIADSGASAIGKALQANKALTELHLGGNLVGPEGAVQLASALEANETVRTLNLRSNAILDVGAVAIARMCKRNDALVELYLGSNGISEEGCAALADSWRSNTRLQKVDLQGAAAGRTGALAIAEALKVNRSLKQLVVEIEPGNKEGASAVANALRSNTTITELALGESGALDEGILAAVNGTLRVNKFITTIGNGAWAARARPTRPQETPAGCSRRRRSRHL